MNILTDIVRNPVFLSAGGSWLVAQVSKIIYETIRYLRFRQGQDVRDGVKYRSH